MGKWTAKWVPVQDDTWTERARQSCRVTHAAILAMMPWRNTIVGLLSLARRWSGFPVFIEETDVSLCCNFLRLQKEVVIYHRLIDILDGREHSGAFHFHRISRRSAHGMKAEGLRCSWLESRQRDGNKCVVYLSIYLLNSLLVSLVAFLDVYLFIYLYLFVSLLI